MVAGLELGTLNPKPETRFVVGLTQRNSGDDYQHPANNVDNAEDLCRHRDTAFLLGNLVGVDCL